MLKNISKMKSFQLKLFKYKKYISGAGSIVRSFSDYAISRTPLSFIGGIYDAGEKILNLKSYNGFDEFNPSNNWFPLFSSNITSQILKSVLQDIPAEALDFEHSSCKLLTLDEMQFVVMSDNWDQDAQMVLCQPHDKAPLLQRLAELKMKELGGENYLELIEVERDKRNVEIAPFPMKVFESKNADQLIKHLENVYAKKIFNRSLALWGMPGCHEKGQLIMMADGSTKKVEEVSVGDTLMGPGGEPREVLELRRGFGKMVKIKPVKGKSFIVNDDHILTLVRNNAKLSKNLTKFPKYEYIDVSVKDYLKWNNMYINAHKLVRSKVQSFKNEKTEFLIDPYHLGILIGDGCLNISTSITNNDENVVNEAEKLAEKFSLSLNKVNSIRKSDADTYTFTGTKGKTNLLTSIIKDLGLNVGSGDKFIPFEYKTSSINSRLEILAGLIDTDGSLDDCNCLDYVSKSQQLAEDVAFVSRSLGLAAYVKECQKSAHKNHVGTYYRVCISGNIDIIPTRILKKNGKKRNQIKNVLHTGFEIEYVRDDYFYGFTLNKDGRYLIDDFTITHNTGKTSISAKLLSHFNFKTLKFRPSETLTLNVLMEIVDLFKIEAVILDDMDRLYTDDRLLNFLDILNSKVKLTIGICNSLTALDPALLRPGRFDEVIKVEGLDENTIKLVLGPLYEEYHEKVKTFPIAYLNELSKHHLLDEGGMEEKFLDLKDRVARLEQYYKERKILKEEEKEEDDDDDDCVSSLN